MERKIDKELIKWQASASPRPLIITGTRQIGKTYSVLKFGASFYKDVAYFNLEDNYRLTNILDTAVGVDNIILKLGKLIGFDIKEEETLIIFDEIQLYEKILPILKYFNDSVKKYHIVAIGTYYEPITNTKKYSYPVGSVELKTMHGIDFEEYLNIIGKSSLIPYIYQAYDTNKPLSYHRLASDLYKEYLLVGSFPSAVAAKMNGENYEYINKNINKVIVSDMLKSSLGEEMLKLKEAYDIIPMQLLKKNKKYQYSLIKRGARSYEYDNSIDFLKAGNVIAKSSKLLEISRPLSNFADKGNFKVYFKEIGLLSSKIGNDFNVLMENHIASSLTMNGYQLYFWESDGKASIDFVIYDKEGNIVPVDVKYPGVKSKSLSVYIAKYQPVKVMRISMDNFSYKDGIKNIPAYATFCMKG